MATVSYLIVGAGGGAGKGGAGATRGAGGGGAGDLLTGSDTITAVGLYPVVVGTGGAATTSTSGTGTTGGSSSWNGHTAAGGGGGGSGSGGAPTTGGSGGGSGDDNGSAQSGATGAGTNVHAGGSATPGGSSSSGGSGGGGGGSSAAGANGAASGTTRPAGGAGTASSISGASVTYAAGGAGGSYNGDTAGADGTDGLGNGGNGGDGQGLGSGRSGGRGGNGVVILSYPTGALTASGGTITQSGGNTIHTFTSSGTFIVANPKTLIATQSQQTTLARLKVKLVTLFAQVSAAVVTLLRQFVLDALVPSSDRTTGGATVTLLSTMGHFESGCTVTFGGVAATGVSFVSSTIVTCTAPANAAGVVDVVVTNPSGSQLKKTAGFTYFTPAATNTSMAATVSGTPLRIRENGGAGLQLSLIRNQPSSATFDTDQVGVAVFNPIRIGVGSVADNDLLFCGEVEQPTTSHEGHPSNQVWKVSAVDRHYRLKRRLAYKVYSNVSATTVARDLVASYVANEFTTVNVQAGLPVISVTFLGQDLDQCFSQIASLIGGSFYIQVNDIHLYVGSETPTFTPDTVSESTPSVLDDPAMEYTPDITQVRNRVNVTGAGTTIPTAVAAGETIVPVAAADLFSDTGGGAILPASAQTITYAGRQTSVAGSLVGPGASPSSAPAVALASGAGLSVGAYQYAYTDVTGSGESLPSPVASITTGTAPAPSSAPSASLSSGSGVDAGTHLYAVTFLTSAGETTAGPTTSASPGRVTLAPPGSGGVTADAALGGSLTLGSWYAYALSFVDDLGGETTATFEVSGHLNASNNAFSIQGIPTSPHSNVVARRLYRSLASGNSGDVNPKFLVTTLDNTSSGYFDGTSDASLGGGAPSSNTATTPEQVVTLSGIPKGGSIVTGRKIYRTVAGGSQLKLLVTLGDDTTTSYVDTIADASLGANVPVSNTATACQVSLTGIAIGPSGVTSRKLYRTAVGGTQLKFVVALGDNATTTYLDSLGDGSLGANAPVGDTSGLALTSGLVLAGSTSLLLAGAGAFSPTGGWAQLASSQYIRYTGISGNTLTGIPAAGAGAIVASVNYNSTCTAVPALTGVPSSGAGALTAALGRGDAINLFTQRNDLNSQAIVAAAEGDGSDGIHEYPVNDTTLTSVAACAARGDAELALFSTPPATLVYTSTDLKAAVPGRLVAFNVTTWGISGTLLIQQVDLLSWDENVGPILRITASTVRYTIADVMRNMVIIQ
ncbi:MAG TPA: IPT/TIG domain-containing protein [Vicinamibacterales bacterium]|nr:IPT/TIG domain-containing protein [Vicinamibacterales bacterium]